jgi:hypothetical protein
MESNSNEKAKKEPAGVSLNEAGQALCLWWICNNSTFNRACLYLKKY